MGFRVRPQALEVCLDEPFRNDRLERREAAEALAKMVQAIDGPCVIAVDAEWGMGKTTFLDMWRALLLGKKIPVVMFNAWDNDFADEPFLALSEELASAVQTNGEDRRKKLRTAAADVLANIVPTIGSALVSPLLGGTAGQMAEEVFQTAIHAAAGRSGSRYEEAKNAMEKFREVLEQAAKAESIDSPLIVVVDELDRCRPSYAIELLEVMKHLFAVDGIVFVLGVNRTQLECSVQSLYGQGINASEYLRRFIDIDLRLPAAERKKFIASCLDEISRQLGGRNKDHDKSLKGLGRTWLQTFFGSSEIDLRTMQQALQRLGLVVAMLDDEHSEVPAQMATLLLILRTLDPVTYRQFTERTATDAEVADALFERTRKEFRFSSEGLNLEAKIIMAMAEDQFAHGPGDQIRSPLYSRYQNMINSADRSTDFSAHPELDHAIQVIGLIRTLKAEWIMGNGRYEFERAIRLLEIVFERRS